MTLDEPRWLPYHWWGDAWSRPNEYSLPDLITNGMINLQQANLLVERIGRGESVVVVAESAGAGKSTLAYAFLAHLPNFRAAVHIRGAHEQFGWIRSWHPNQLTLLVNEISDHLPVYLHGQALDSTVALVSQGSQLIATAHPSGFELLLSKLTSEDRDRATPLTSVWINGHHPGPFRVSTIERRTEYDPLP